MDSLGNQDYYHSKGGGSDSPHLKKNKYSLMVGTEQAKNKKES